MNVPDYVSPVVAYRAWLFGPRGLMSLNGEFWHPNQKLQAVCRRSVNRHTPPHGDCSCGIYAAKSFDQLRGLGYAELGVYGEVCLWGTVVEHKLGWRAQFAYPRTLVIGPESLLFGRLVQRDLCTEELESLKILIGYGADLFVAGEKENVPLWTKQCGGFDHVREVAARLAQSRPSDQQQVRLVIADDCQAIRAPRYGLRRLFEAKTDHKVIGEASNGTEALQLARQLKPDILLTDLAHPGLTAMEIVRELNTPANPTPVRVILVTACDAPSLIVEALQLGARGVVLKPFATRVLLKAIQTVMAGGYWVDREQVSNLSQYLRKSIDAEAGRRQKNFDLTPRELEIVSAVVAGYSNKEIAEYFKISENTVKHHLSHIFDKLLVCTRLELALFAVNIGLPLQPIV